MEEISSQCPYDGLSKGNIRNVMMLLKKWHKYGLLVGKTQPMSTQGKAMFINIE